jgi:hypothetical protein
MLVPLLLVLLQSGPSGGIVQSNAETVVFNVRWTMANTAKSSRRWSKPS